MPKAMSIIDNVISGSVRTKKDLMLRTIALDGDRVVDQMIEMFRHELQLCYLRSKLFKPE